MTIRRFALLVGVSAYEDSGLAELVATEADVEALRDVLEDTDIGVFDKVVPLLNPTRDEFFDGVHDLFDKCERDDLALLYFSGHGIVDVENRFFFAIKDTHVSKPHKTAVHYRDIHEIMEQSRAGGQLIILDCCHAGAFSQRAKAQPNRKALSPGIAGSVKDRPGAGRWVLAATDATSFAFEQDELVAESEAAPKLGVFTKFLVEGLRGAAGEPQNEWITAGELFDFARVGTQSEVPAMRPEQSVAEGSEPLRVAKKRPKPRLPPDIEQRLRGSDYYAALGACHHLRELLEGQDAGLAAEAERAMRAVVKEPGEILHSIYKQVDVALAKLEPPTPTPLSVYRDVDAPWCPEMVALEGGTFLMGSPEGEVGRYDVEGPQRQVTVAGFAIGRYPVTFAEYDRFCEATGREKPEDLSWGRGRMPVINVSWHDARMYAAWLSEQTGKGYRLATEAEWEYACRAGTGTAYWWGSDFDPTKANTEEGCRRRTTEVGSYPANPWGLFDICGNVMEWVEDHWHDSYREAPNYGHARVDAEVQENRPRVLRGGSWNFSRDVARCAFRNGSIPSDWGSDVGFRVVLFVPILIAGPWSQPAP